MAGAGSPTSLKARALRWVSQREHSTVEMRRKLLDAARRQKASAEPLGVHPGAGRQRRGDRVAVVDGAVANHGASGRLSADPSDAGEPGAPADDGDGAGIRSSERGASFRSPEALAEVEAVIAWLLANDFLSDQRFVESRLHARESGQGCARIRRELAEHGLDLPEAAAAALRHTELERAAALCRRRFGDGPAASPSEDARRYRFLLRRGFSGDVVVRVIRDMRRAA